MACAVKAACSLCVTLASGSSKTHIAYSDRGCYHSIKEKQKNRSSPIPSHEATPLLRSDFQSSLGKAALARLLVLLIVWSQASFAAHQFEHAIDDVGEPCAVCLQFERCDDAVPAADTHPPMAVPAAVEYAGASAVFYARPFAPYLSRASP